MTHPADTPNDPTHPALDTRAEPGSEATAGDPATVVSGRVGTWDAADRLQQGLIGAGFAQGDIEIFYTGPAGRHDVTPFGGDSYSDAGATHMGTGAVSGGVAGGAAGLAVGVLGAALVSVNAPLALPVILTAAAVGALGGSLAGGVTSTDDGMNIL
jgi:hypothetical protein